MTAARRKTPEDLRSARWFSRPDLRTFAHRSRTKQAGFAEAEFAARPVIGILNTWSDANSCHTHLRQRAEEVKRGVWQKGGFPLEMPVLSVGETYMKPTTMLYRNLLAMETEEIIRANPVDGVVLLGGCDKTVPGLVMGATSANLPAVFVSAVRCCAGTGAGRSWAAAATFGSTGRRSERASSTIAPGARWRTASRAPSAPA